MSLLKSSRLHLVHIKHVLTANEIGLDFPLKNYVYRVIALEIHFIITVSLYMHVLKIKILDSLIE
jgi:hypothetical protein